MRSLLCGWWYFASRKTCANCKINDDTRGVHCLEMLNQHLKTARKLKLEYKLDIQIANEGTHKSESTTKWIKDNTVRQF